MKRVSFEKYIESDDFDMESLIMTNDSAIYTVKELIELVNNNEIDYEKVKIVTIL